MEPTTTTTTGFALSKLWLGAGGAVGSGTIGAFWQPAALKDYGKVTKGVIIGGVGVSTPVVAGGFVMHYLGLDTNSADMGMFVGWVMSILSVIFYVSITNYFKKHEDKDLFEVVAETKSQVAKARTATKKPAAKKVAAKRVAAKKAVKK